MPVNVFVYAHVQVCSVWVKPLTAKHGRCRLVEVPGLLDPGGGEVGRPLYFLSHAWSNSIELLFSKVGAGPAGGGGGAGISGGLTLNQSRKETVA